MTNTELAACVASGIIDLGIEGGFDNVTKSTGGNYLSIGVSSWEGERADAILERLAPEYVNSRFTDLDRYDLEMVKNALTSVEGLKLQRRTLTNDAENYIESLQSAPYFYDSRCLIYAAMWCPTSTLVVTRFITKLYEKGYNINSLKVLNDKFIDGYSIAADCIEYQAGYCNRAERTFAYVAALDLTTRCGVPAYGQGIYGP